jgi:hypothetical protein
MKNVYVVEARLRSNGNWIKHPIPEVVSRKVFFGLWETNEINQEMLCWDEAIEYANKQLGKPKYQDIRITKNYEGSEYYADWCVWENGKWVDEYWVRAY